MKLLSLNIRGFGGDSQLRLLREMIQKEEVGFVAIQGTLLKGEVSGILKLLWPSCDYGYCFVPSLGRSGGLLCMWRKDTFEASVSFAGSGLGNGRVVLN